MTTLQKGHRVLRAKKNIVRGAWATNCPGWDAVQAREPAVRATLWRGWENSTTPASWLPILPPMPTWNIALGLNASGEVSVLRDGMAVVIQWRELGRDLGVAWYQHWR